MWAADVTLSAELAQHLLSTCPYLLSPGTSLLQEVVYLVSQGADPDEIGLMNIDEQLPVLEYPQPGLDIIKVLPARPASPHRGRASATSADERQVLLKGLMGLCGWGQ